VYMRRIALLAVSTILVVLGVLAFGSSGEKAPPQAGSATLHQRTFRHVPVVMVVFDEFPVASLMNTNGNIDGALFPSFRRLQEDSIWFRNATAVATFTKYAVPALLTGQYQEPTSSPETYPANIFTILGDAYGIHTIEPLPGICPSDLCDSGAPNRIGSQLQEELGAFANYDRGANFAAFLEKIEAVDEPRFYFLHLVIPHSPWRYLPSGRRYPESEPIPGQVELPGPGRGWIDDKWLVTQAFQRHLLQVRLVDKMVGTLIHRLKRLNLYRKSALIVTADHGLAFEPGFPKRVVEKKTIGDLTAVPLFVKPPYRAPGRISDVPVETTDIVPTIADLLNLSDVWRGIDGTSALDGSIEPTRVRTVNGIEVDPGGSEKYTLVRQKYRSFASRGDRLDLFRTAPGRGERLIGRSIDELSVASPDGQTAYVKNGRRFRKTTPNAEPFPAILQGTINGAGQRRVKVAVAVNGRIAAVTRSFDDRGTARFYCMLPPKAFGKPPNELELFLVEDVAAGTLSMLTMKTGL
jgi:hypothetical protein